MPGRIIVVGASLAGLRTAEQLRVRGWAGDVTVVGSEALLPYNRPPLSKEVLAGDPKIDLAAEHAKLAFRHRRSLGAVTWRLGVSATAADLEAREVAFSDGERLAYDGLVVATGLRPRRIPLPGPHRGRHAIRTLEDARSLRRELVPGAHVVVIGSGFIGSEVAATATRLGCKVCIVEPQATPMERPLGTLLGQAIQAHHEAEGIEFHLGRSVSTFEGANRVTGVELDDGTRLCADVVVEAIGSHCNVEWLAQNGLDLSDGVLCDNWLRVEDKKNVVAVGDIARFPNPTADNVPRRVEHWCVPGDTAKRAARTLVDALTGKLPDLRSFAPIPSFWSDQFDLRIQGFGTPVLADDVQVVEGEANAEGIRRGSAFSFTRDGVPVGFCLVNLPARAPHYREMLMAMRETAA